MRETEREVSGLSSEGLPSLDLVFEVLADRRRRFALYYLQDLSDDVATLDELADHVVGLETERETGTTETQRKRVVTSLQHVHLPKLDEAGILDYDARSRTARYWGQPTIEELLDHARHKELH